MADGHPRCSFLATPVLGVANITHYASHRRRLCLPDSGLWGLALSGWLPRADESLSLKEFSKLLLLSMFIS